MDQNIIYKVDKGVGWLTLNRPEKLNAISVEMVDELYNIFKDWKNNDEVSLVVLQGAGEKAFCAGGDVKHLYEIRESDVHAVVESSFDKEYRMDMLVHTLGKPLVVYMNGIVLGSGVGMSVAGSHRIVTEKTKWAMPEMNIGLYPDVGGSYFLNKMPHNIGRYIGLTSSMISAADVIYSGAADHYLTSSNWSKLANEIKGIDWRDSDVVSTLDKVVHKFSEPCPESAMMQGVSHDIESHFRYNTLEEIVQSLEEASENGNKWAEETVKTILTKSPTSLKVTLEQLIRGKNLPLKDCFIMELELSMNFMDSPDFFEGVRSVLVDKDRNPSWKPDTLDAVSKECVEAFFTYNWDDHNPLIDFEV